MKRIFSCLMLTLLSAQLFAQQPSDKLVLKKGDLIKVKSDITSNQTQTMGGEPMEMKTTIATYSELMVKEVLEDGYLVIETLKKMKFDFNGFGQDMHYNSEDKEKSNNPMLGKIAEKIDQAEENKVGFDGKVVKKEKEDKMAKGMMSMMNIDGGALSAAFLLIPKDALEKKTWETNETNDEGLNIRKRYTINSLMGNIASISVKGQTKGDIDFNQGGMAITTKVNTLHEDELMVDITTGRVQMRTSSVRNNSTSIINGTDSPSSGTTTTSTTFE